MKRYLTLLFAALVVAACGEGKLEPEQPDTPAVPSQPTNLELRKKTETSLTFQWNAVEGAASYTWEIKQGETKVQEGNEKTRNVEVKNLTRATDYRFGVKAVNAVGASSMTWIDARTEGTEDPVGPTPTPTDEYYADFSIPEVEEDGVARAFPGAEGGGMYATGGRGGKVLHVTTLQDTGSKGSLRWAVNQSGARTVVFDVPGIIELSSPIQVKNGDLTIAGQTAPGDGICLKNYTFNINADNVIIRFIHFRLGDEGPDAGDGEDCVWGRYHSDIILDHCSMSWSIDECASFYANENFTLQWSILTESMNDSAHSKGAHGYGGIWGGKNASFHHNLLANHHSRNPRIDHPEIYPDKGNYTYVFDLSKRGNVDLRNLVIYNWGDNSSYGGEDGHFNFVNCFYQPGPNSKDRHYFVDAYKDYSREVRDQNGKKTGEKLTVHYAYPVLYMSGNHHAKYSDITGSNSSGIYWHNGGSAELAATPFTIQGADGKPAYATTHPVSEGKDAVLDWAGDRLHRDSVDERAVEGVKNNTGRIINTPSDVGGWPSYSATDEQKSKVADGDGDGMPDWFEEKYGLGTSDKNDGSLITLDKNGRYTNLEMYLHYLVKDIVAAQNAGGTYTKL